MRYYDWESPIWRRLGTFLFSGWPLYLHTHKVTTNTRTKTGFDHTGVQICPVGELNSEWMSPPTPSKAHSCFKCQIILIWLVVWTPLKKYESQLGWLFPIYGKIKMATKPPTRYNSKHSLLHSTWTPPSTPTTPAAIPGAVVLADVPRDIRAVGDLGDHLLVRATSEDGDDIWEKPWWNKMKETWRKNGWCMVIFGWFMVIFLVIVGVLWWFLVIFLVIYVFFFGDWWWFMVLFLVIDGDLWWFFWKKQWGFVLLLLLINIEIQLLLLLLSRNALRVKINPESHDFLIKIMDVSGFNFPINQSIDTMETNCDLLRFNWKNPIIYLLIVISYCTWLCRKKDMLVSFSFFDLSRMN